MQTLARTIHMLLISHPPPEPRSLQLRNQVIYGNKPSPGQHKLLRRLRPAVNTQDRITQEMDSAIHDAWANPGQAAHNIRGSLPYRMFPVCCDLSLSNFRSGLVKPRFSRSTSMSSGLPVKNVQPGLVRYDSAYFLSTWGVSSSGF